VTVRWHLLAARRELARVLDPRPAITAAGQGEES
jgi:hypothetical protein